MDSIRYFINWITGLHHKTGRKIVFKFEDHVITHEEYCFEGYLYDPPVFTNKNLIIYCHGGWGSLEGVTRLKDVDYYVNHGYSVLVVRYDDEFTPAPTDLNLYNDIRSVHTALCLLRYDRFILMGVSRGGFVAYQAMSGYWWGLDACVIGGAPSDIEALATFPPVAILFQDPGIKSYFYQWLSPIKKPTSLNQKPLLIVHGAKDDVIPVSQANDMVTALIGAGGSPVLKIFKDMGHSLMTKRPVMRYIVKWLGKLP